jgi:hypothetical protein
MAAAVPVPSVASTTTEPSKTDAKGQLKPTPYSLLVKLADEGKYEQLANVLGYRVGMDVLGIADKIAPMIPEEFKEAWTIGLSKVRDHDNRRPPECDQQMTLKLLKILVHRIDDAYKHKHKKPMEKHQMVNNLLYNVDVSS